MAEKDKQPEVGLKRKSNDIAWDYGELFSEEKRDWITCKLCEKLIKGGVHRMKLHIAGLRGNVEPCPKASDEDIAKVKACIEKSKNRKQKRDDGIQMNKSKHPGPIDKRTSAIDPKRARQQNINDAWNTKFANVVHEYLARWIYESEVPFHAIDNEGFRQFVEAVGKFGLGYKPPSQYLLREPLLKQEVERTKLSLKKHEEEWSKHGCSIMTDAWTDRKRRSIMNLCVNCKLGTSFLGSVEDSTEAHTGKYIFDFVEKYINEIGPQNVVQVVTDNAANNMAAADLLQNTQPQIFWSSCATHTINLMLEGIGKLTMFSGMLEKAKQLTIFIYAHHRTLAIMRKYTKKRDIVRPGVTRFATSFLTLESLKGKKDQLRLMFTSEEWSKTKLKSSVKGKAVEATVTSISFWNNVSLALNVFTPLVKVLRLVDGDKKPSMAFVMGALKQAKEEIRNAFKKEENAKPILKIIDEKSKGRLDSPLHYAAYLLNPVFYFKDPSIDKDNEVMNEFLNCIEKLFPGNLDMQSTISNNELVKYKTKSGNFGREMAMVAYKNVDMYHDFDPVGWWSNYGGDTPNLQNMAIRFLSLTSSSSGCERNWSQFEAVHTKKRNRLEASRLNDLVYVKFNSNLMKKKSKREMGGDLLLSSQASEAQGWLVDGGDDDEIELGSVAEASGADEVLEPRSARNLPIAIRELDEDLDTSDEEKDEEVVDGGDDDEIELGSVAEASGADEVPEPRRSARNLTIAIIELDEDLDISDEEKDEEVEFFDGLIGDISLHMPDEDLDISDEEKDEEVEFFDDVIGDISLHMPGHLRRGVDGHGPVGHILPGDFRRNETMGSQNFPNFPWGVGFGGFRGHVDIGQPGLPGNFPHLHASREGDMDPFDHSRKRKPGNMVRCLICKIDCETVEGLDLHSQTREHQKMAMDVVLGIKKDNAKKLKLTSEHAPSFEGASK